MVPKARPENSFLGVDQHFCRVPGLCAPCAIPGDAGVPRCEPSCSTPRCSRCALPCCTRCAAPSCRRSAQQRPTDAAACWEMPSTSPTRCMSSRISCGQSRRSSNSTHAVCACRGAQAAAHQPFISQDGQPITEHPHRPSLACESCRHPSKRDARFPKQQWHNQIDPTPAPAHLQARWIAVHQLPSCQHGMKFNLRGI